MSCNEMDMKGVGVADALRKISKTFLNHGLENAQADARMLLLGATGRTRHDLMLSPSSPLDDAAVRRLKDFVARRLAGEPATRIVGERAFWTLYLRVTPDVLDPRPDTESLIVASLEAIGTRKEEPLRILDLGTGSGALLLALLSEFPLATGVGIDLSAEACAVARENADRNGLAARADIRQGRWTDGLAGTFDLVVSNPPYIETAEISQLSVEVRQHDPLLALDGGADGLAAYRDITKRLPAVLSRGGVAVLELGFGQGRAVARLAEEAGLSVTGSKSDLGGIERALVLAAPL
jgi:release factor glutamine methyltransferase